MLRNLSLLLAASAMILSACGTLDISIEQQNAPIIPLVDATKTTLEMEATSMSAFVTQQAATMIALTQMVPSAAPPTETPAPLSPWQTYQSSTYGFSLEYPAIYDTSPYAETCGIGWGNEALHIGHQIEIQFVPSRGLNLDEYARDLLQEKDWRVESQREEGVSGLRAITVDYRFGGANRFGTLTLLEYHGLVYIFQLMAGGSCVIPEYELTEPEVYAHVLQSFRILALNGTTTPGAR
jgi:hypothetical protein